MKKIYIVGESSFGFGEFSGNASMGAFFSKEKADRLKEKLEKIEEEKEAAEQKCSNCNFNKSTYAVKNEQTFIRRAKQICIDANFVWRNDEYGDLWLECSNEIDGDSDVNFYYIVETELVDG